MSEKKIKQLRKRIKPLQVEWLKSLLPEDQAKDITVDNVDGFFKSGEVVAANDVSALTITSFS